MTESISFHLWVRAARRSMPSTNPTRKALGYCLSQKELAELAGCYYVTISQYERNVRTPHPIIREKLFSILPTQDQLARLIQ